MIAYIKGKVLYSFENGVVLENNGVGYEIICSASALTRLTNDREGAVYTYLQVKEDGICLFGFDTIEEKKMFLKLISVSGIGPKMGISVLSGMNLNDLAIAIGSSDVKTLCRVKGLGKKTAERIILELREKVSEAVIGSDGGSADSETLKSEDEDAVIALMSLGFQRAPSIKAVKTARSQGAEKLEDIISASLRNI